VGAGAPLRGVPALALGRKVRTAACIGWGMWVPAPCARSATFSVLVASGVSPGARAAQYRAGAAGACHGVACETLWRQAHGGRH